MRLIAGLQPVREALRAHGDALLEVLIENSASPQLDALCRFVNARGAKLRRVGRDELDRLAKGARHQGALAYANPLALLDESTITGRDGFLGLALDELEDPQNFGAITRTAVAFGVDCILFPESHSAPLSPAMFRASAGAVEHAKLSRVRKLPDTLRRLSDEAVQVVGLAMEADKELADLDLTLPTIIVVGAEGKGLRRGVKQACTVLGKLPMPGPIASLNASVAAALAMYEVLRQRRGTSAPSPAVETGEDGEDFPAGDGDD